MKWELIPNLDHKSRSGSIPLEKEAQCLLTNCTTFHFAGEPKPFASYSSRQAWNLKTFASPAKIGEKLTRKVSYAMSDIAPFMKLLTCERLSFIESPFGYMPILEVDGKKISGSYVCARFLGEKFGKPCSLPWSSGGRLTYVVLSLLTS